MEPVNLPEVVAEVPAALERYEHALVHNEVAVLDELFWDSPHTVRLGASEDLFGAEEIRDFRRTRPPKGLARTVIRTQITTFGTDFAVAHRLYTREGEDQPGRQTQTWVRTGTGWKVVSAHVSTRKAPPHQLPR